MRSLRERDEILEKLWNEFTDVPMDPDAEHMEEPFLGFPAGTPREDLWHWFDERHSKGVAYLLYGDGVDRTPEMAQLCYMKQLCIECDSESCIFNPEGICMFPMVSGRSPIIHDDGCHDWRWRDEK